MFRGKAYSKKRNFDGAIADFTEAIRLNPKNDSPFYFRGGAYLENGDYDRAIADYTEVIQLNPTDVFASYYGRGLAYMGKIDYGRAVSDFIIVVEFEHAPAEMVKTAAFFVAVRYENGEGVALDYSQAMHWYRIAADRGDETAMAELGLLYAKAGDCYSARHWTEKAAAAGSENAKRALRSPSFAGCRW